MSTMYDSVNASAIHASFPSPDIVAGYVDGRYAWAATDWSLFPAAQHVTITVLGQAGANVVDCETGDLTPSQAASWAQAEIAAGRRPTIYCNTSTWPSVNAALTGLGISLGSVDFWVAQYDGVAEIPAGAVAKQYQSTAQYDISLTNGSWPSQTAPAPPPPPPSWTNYPTPNLKFVTLTVLIDANGNGWCPIPEGVAADDIVSVVPVDIDPAQINTYAPIPRFAGVTSDNKLVFSGLQTPSATYGFNVWAISSG